MMLTYSLTCNFSVYWITRMSADLEKAIVSVERVKEYSEVASETDTLQQAAPCPASWPHSGEIVFSGYSTRWASNTIKGTISVPTLPQVLGSSLCDTFILSKYA